MNRIWVVLVCLIASATLATHNARAASVIVGVNIEDVQSMNIPEQDALIGQLQRYGVKTVRVGLDPRFTPFIIKAYRSGISAEAIVSIKTSGGHVRPADPAVGLTWSEAPLSAADPTAFKAYLTGTMAPLEAAGMHLAAFELGNEINNPHFNGDFFAPGTHRILGLSDLNNPRDAEGQAIARGFKAYIELLAALKETREGMRVNRATPIISAGLADGGLPGSYPQFKIDGVGIAAAIEFLRQNGMDRLVDGYGIHVYPSPNPSTTISTRMSRLNADAFAACATGTKPCWLTEWGFNNNNASCPIDDAARERLIATMRQAFKSFVEQGRLAAILYFSWSGHKGIAESAEAIFRCGSLTPAGRLAISPL